MRKCEIPEEIRIGDTVEVVVDHPDSSDIETGDIATVFCYDVEDDSAYAYGVVFENPSDRIECSLHSLYGSDADDNGVHVMEGGFWMKPHWVRRIDDSWLDECERPDLGELFGK